MALVGHIDLDPASLDADAGAGPLDIAAAERRIDSSMEELEGVDSALAEAQRDLANEMERGRQAIKAAEKKAQDFDDLRMEVRKRRLAQVQVSRRNREELRERARGKRELAHTEAQADQVWAAVKIQAGFRGRRTRIHGAKRRVVVVGATGQIGAAVCRHCLRRDFEVIGMCRDPSTEPALALRRAGIRMYAGDLDDEYSVDRVIAFAVHGSPTQHHTHAHTHTVGRGNIHGLFVLTPHWRDDGAQAGIIADAARELQRAKHCINAARRARVTHVVLSSACAGGDEVDTGPRSEEYTKRRCCVERHAPMPGHIRSKAAIEEYLEGSLGPYPYAKVGLRQVFHEDITGHVTDPAYPIEWTILRPVALMDNFWSSQTPWCHVNTHVRMPIPRRIKQQLVWSDDVGAVAARAFDEGSGGLTNWYGLKLDLVGDEVNGTEIARAFTKARRDPQGRGAASRGPRRLRYVKDLPPCGRLCAECECIPAACSCVGEPFGWLLCWRLQEWATWDDAHYSSTHSRFVTNGGGGALTRQVRRLVPELHTLEAALIASNWGGRPNPEWSSSMACGWFSAPCWGLAALLFPWCLASWTAKKLWRDDSQCGHAVLCGLLWPLTACQLRARTREQLHLDANEYGTWGHCDTCSVMLCPFCALSQQARELYGRTRRPPRARPRDPSPFLAIDKEPGGGRKSSQGKETQSAWTVAADGEQMKSPPPPPPAWALNKMAEFMEAQGPTDDAADHYSLELPGSAPSSQMVPLRPQIIDR